MNLCIFSGRLGRDAEQRNTASGTAVTNFAIAVDCGFGENKRTEWINCVMWKRDGLAAHLTKGKAVTVSGELQTREWEDRDGSKRKQVEIVVREIEFQQGASQAQEGPSRGSQAKGHGQAQGRPQLQGGGRPPRQEGMEPDFPDNSGGLDSVPF